MLWLFLYVIIIFYKMHRLSLSYSCLSKICCIVRLHITVAEISATSLSFSSKGQVVITVWVVSSHSCHSPERFVADIA